MKKIPLLLLRGCLFLACLSALFPKTLFAQPNADSAPKFAILVGVGRYTHLPESSQLGGTENDVRLMREVLSARFGFADDEIEVLTGEQATGDAIRRTLERLINRLETLPADSPPAQVIFHFSGHGSQLPDQTGPERDESDGLDETLVPADATMIGGEEDIRDDELNRIAHRICKDGRAKLWIILDCCHSGTGTRSVGKNDSRGLVGFRTLRRKLEPTRSPLSPNVNTLPDTAIALYACRDQELAPEYFDGDHRYGLLTRFMTQVLLDSGDASSLTYAALRDSIAARYRQDRKIGISAPIPQVEGSPDLLDGNVLGNLQNRPQRYWKVDATTAKPTLLAGAFHGISKDSVFELFESPEAISSTSDPADHDVADRASESGSLGFARVSRAEAASSSLQFVTWNKTGWVESRWPRTLKEAFAVRRSHGENGFGLRVHVINASSPSGEKSLRLSEFPSGVQSLFSEQAKSDGKLDWLSVVDDLSDADLVLKIAGDRAAAFPASDAVVLAGSMPDGDAASRLDARLAGGWGPIELGRKDTAEKLMAMLRQITKARNLLRIAGRETSGGQKPIQVELELLRYDLDEPQAEMEPWPNATPGKTPASLVMNSGECYSYRITNRSRAGQDAYVTILHVTSDMGIEQVFPYQDGSTIQGLEECRLRAGESRIEGPFQCNGTGDPSFGPRHTVVLATAQPNHFYMLNQENLPTLKGPVTRSTASDSSLADLLMEGAYFTTRSRRRPVSLYDDSWGAAVLQWTVQPPDSDRP